MRLAFEWDERKAHENLRKHKVSFEETKTVFDDPFLMTYPDTTHSDTEQRYLSIGMSIAGRILVVVHTDRMDKIRLISSRRATLNERVPYEETRY